MPVFTSEYVVDYWFDIPKEKMRAEDWKSFKAEGFKLFKEGRV